MRPRIDDSSLPSPYDTQLFVEKQFVELFRLQSTTTSPRFVERVEELARSTALSIRQIHQHIVNRNHPARRVERLRIRLPPRQPLPIEGGRIPLYFRDPPVETRLIRGLGKLRVDAGDVLLLSHQQAGPILGQVPPFGRVGKHHPTLLDGVLNNRGKLNNGGHPSSSTDNFLAQSPLAYRTDTDLARPLRCLQKLSQMIENPLMDG